jgi:hypothetical protein
MSAACWLNCGLYFGEEPGVEARGLHCDRQALEGSRQQPRHTYKTALISTCIDSDAGIGLAHPENGGLRGALTACSATAEKKLLNQVLINGTREYVYDLF